MIWSAATDQREAGVCKEERGSKGQVLPLGRGECVRDANIFLGEHGPDPPSASALGAEICTNVMCPCCALASVMSWLCHSFQPSSIVAASDTLLCKMVLYVYFIIIFLCVGIIQSVCMEP